MLHLSILNCKTIKVPKYIFLDDGISTKNKKKVVFKQVSKKVNLNRKMFNEKRK